MNQARTSARPVASRTQPPPDSAPAAALSKSPMELLSQTPSPEEMILELEAKIKAKEEEMERLRKDRTEAELKAKEAESKAAEATTRLEEIASASMSVPVYIPPVERPAPVLSTASFAPAREGSPILLPSAPSLASPSAPPPSRGRVIEAAQWGECNTLLVDVRNTNSPPFEVEWSIPAEQSSKGRAVRLRFVEGRARVPRDIATFYQGLHPRYRIMS